jgi:hypothetical protein
VVTTVVVTTVEAVVAAEVASEVVEAVEAMAVVSTDHPQATSHSSTQSTMTRKRSPLRLEDFLTKLDLRKLLTSSKTSSSSREVSSSEPILMVERTDSVPSYLTQRTMPKMPLPPLTASTSDQDTSNSASSPMVIIQDLMDRK